MFDMILVIGGAYQGKEKFAESLREQEKKAGRERTIVPQFHEWVKNCMMNWAAESFPWMHLNVHGGSVPDG